MYILLVMASLLLYALVQDIVELSVTVAVHYVFYINVLP